ncbi:unnamed protein product [Closterium sp. Naga37s-1]|nr:unnamed protein product [Closterium sp. Naga37s-1]
MEGARVALARVSPSDFPSPLHTSTAVEEDRRSSESGRWGRVGKYSVDVASVDLHVLPLLSLASAPPPSLPSSSLAPPQPTAPYIESQSQSQSRSESQSPSPATPPEAASRADFSSSCSRAHGTLWVVDEIGKMELLSTRFAAAVTALLDAPLPLLASIPTPLSIARTLVDIAQQQKSLALSPPTYPPARFPVRPYLLLLPVPCLLAVAAIRARPDVFIVEVSRSNRDRLVPLLTDQLLALICSSGGGRNS